MVLLCVASGGCSWIGMTRAPARPTSGPVTCSGLALPAIDLITATAVGVVGVAAVQGASSGRSGGNARALGVLVVPAGLYLASGLTGIAWARTCARVKHRATAAPAPTAAPPRRPSTRHGGTFEVGLGAGWRLPDGRVGRDSEILGVRPGIDFAGPNLGVGGWVNPRLAITGRVAVVRWTDLLDLGKYNAVVVAAAQYWVSARVWFGAGIGLGFGGDALGPGADLRVGYTFARGATRTLNVSLEVTPTYLTYRRGPENPALPSDLGAVTGVVLVLGYQRL